MGLHRQGGLWGDPFGDPSKMKNNELYMAQRA